MNVTKMTDSVKDLLGWWARFTNKAYIEIPLQVITNDTCKVVNPMSAIYGHFNNNYNLKPGNKEPVWLKLNDIKRAVYPISFVLPIVLNQLLDKTFRTLGMANKVKVKNQILMIPNIYNKHISNNKNFKSSWIDYVLILGFLIGEHFKQKCAKAFEILFGNTECIQKCERYVVKNVVRIPGGVPPVCVWNHIQV